MIDRNSSSSFSREDFLRDGYIVVPDVLDAPTIDRLLLSLAPTLSNSGRMRGGVRNLLYNDPVIQDLVKDPVVLRIAEGLIGPGAFAVRVILFDKTPDANWKVVWHQDVTIAVRERFDVPGFGPWSEKEGVPHVQPPVELLQDMVAVRIHLDDCTESNGPVRVIPGSHRFGRLSFADIDKWREDVSEVVCTVPRGGVLAFSSLLLHASSPAIEPSHRRVLHIEYVAEKWVELPGSLNWYKNHQVCELNLDRRVHT